MAQGLSHSDERLFWVRLRFWFWALPCYASLAVMSWIAVQIRKQLVEMSRPPSVSI